MNHIILGSSLGDISKFSGFFDTLHIVKANRVTPGNLNVGNITIDGYSRIIWNTPSSTNDWDDLGSIRFNNVSDPDLMLGMEFKGTVHAFNLYDDHRSCYPLIEMVYLDPDPNNPTERYSRILRMNFIHEWR